MRVISGTLKGRSLNFLKNSYTRPLKDSVKESIFNILKHSNLINVRTEGSNILDLYSGIGSFGIECISRGAEKVTFIEKDNNASNILKGNLIRFSLINKSKIYTDRIEAVDPPFSDNNFLNNLELIKKKKIFNKNHIVITHREVNCEDEFKSFLKIVEIKKYGRSKIIFGIFN